MDIRLRDKKADEATRLNDERDHLTTSIIRWRDPEGYSFPTVPVTALTYLGAAVFFLVAANLQQLPQPPSPFIGNLLPASLQVDDLIQVGVMQVLWTAHYGRRFVEVLFVHDYRRRMGVTETRGAPIYYWIFSSYVGWASNYKLGYKVPHWGFFITGITLFFMGEIGNCLCHIMLTNMRKKRHLTQGAISSHVMPEGFFFNYVSVPHYTFEMLSWIGFFICNFTLAALLFLLASTVTLTIYSWRKHKAYQAEFDGQAGRKLYPTHRKALVPFIF